MTLRIQPLLSALVAFSLLSMSGCGTPKNDGDKLTAVNPEKQEIGQPESLDSPTNQNIISEGRTSGPMLPIYFDFDSSAIRKDQVTRAEKNADFLKGNPSVTVRIEGNCDPRGTSEYNLALGERRALSAKKYLTNLGVEAVRMETISFGEDKILLHGHDEYSWAQNRRDDFVVAK